ncbi:hypothetical protein B0H13DRAFT_1854851 [Mycena leptocephala]|nr:hypothetical protein B0H13DRAFT_1854851 [Mycena leptocephala]
MAIELRRLRIATQATSLRSCTGVRGPVRMRVLAAPPPERTAAAHTFIEDNRSGVHTTRRPSSAALLLLTLNARNLSLIDPRHPPNQYNVCGCEHRTTSLQTDSAPDTPCQIRQVWERGAEVVKIIRTQESKNFVTFITADSSVNIEDAQRALASVSSTRWSSSVRNRHIKSIQSGHTREDHVDRMLTIH